MSTRDPGAAPVRAYLDARASLAALAARVRDIADHDLRALAPWREVFDAVDAPLPALPSRDPAADLWYPADPAGLTGLTDVYEVVGRFAFEGEDGANLRAFAAATDALSGDIALWRKEIQSLGAVPERAAAKAQAMEGAELDSGRAQQAELLKQFEPEAAQLREICAKLLDATRAIKRPDLSRADTAEALYTDYVQRVNALYTKALPYLRAALGELSRVAGVETPPNWPDALPFERSLPQGLAEVPSPETPALLQARQAVEALTAQEAALQRAIDELGVQARRVEGEAASLRQRDAELEREALTAGNIVRWAARLDAVDLAQARVAEASAEGQRRAQAIAQIASEVHRLQAQAAQVQHEATELAQAVAAKEAALAAHREQEPFFGKDDWRRKGDALDHEVETLRGELARRQQGLAAIHAEVAKVRAREPLEQAQVAALTRQLDEARAAEATAQREVAALESALGAGRPARRVTVAQAEELLHATTAARAEAKARVDRLATEARRVKEDLDRAAVQLRQTTTERERAAQGLQVAYRESTAQHEERLRTLGVRRQQAFESHASTVLSGLEESLTQVDRVFIDPARRALLVRAGMMSEAPGRLRDAAASLAAQLPSLIAASGAALDDAERACARLRTFVDEAPATCRAHWAA